MGFVKEKIVLTSLGYYPSSYLAVGRLPARVQFLRDLMAKDGINSDFRMIPFLSILRCRAVARMGHLLGACSIVCSRSRGLESMAFPARRRGR